MILHYTFDDIMCDVIESTSSHINNGWYEPHYHREQCEVEFDFAVEVEFEDFFDFVKPYDFDNWKEEGKNAYERACLDLWNKDWFSMCFLEDDYDFIEFMKDRYEEDAHVACVEEYQ